MLDVYLDNIEVFYCKFDRLMVYEFQLENPDGSAGVCKDMVEISVPFWSIISLWLYERGNIFNTPLSPLIS
jgi:hypothetical protein